MLHKPEGDCCSPTAYMQFNLQKVIQFSFSNAAKEHKRVIHSAVISYPLQRGHVLLWRTYCKGTPPYGDTIKPHSRLKSIYINTHYFLFNFSLSCALGNT